MDVHKIALISASLGGFDKRSIHVPQSLPYDHHHFSDENLPPRDRAMLPRLQAKIPKFFGWQLRPGYDFYMWLDGNLSMAHPDTLKYFYDNCKDHDITVFRHGCRPTIWKEWRYTKQGLDEQSRYLVGRYENEWMDEQMQMIQDDKDYVDDFAVTGGMFMYKNTPKVHAMFKEWWYQNTRYSVQDQISFPYVLKKAGLDVNITEDIYNRCKWLEPARHSLYA